MSLAPTLISSGLHRAGVSVLCPRCFGASSLRNHPVVRSRRGLVNEITPCYRFHFLAPLIQAMSRRGHGRDRMEHIGTWIVSAETMCRLQWTLPAIIGATMSGRGQPTAIVLTLPDDCPLLWDCSYAVPRRRKAAFRQNRPPCVRPPDSQRIVPSVALSKRALGQKRQDTENKHSF